jgi:hypothetical protein
MSPVRVVSMRGLRRRIGLALGEGSPLAELFDHALRVEDEELINDAMAMLQDCAEPVRERVQAAVLDWLFGDSCADLIDLASPSTAVH